VARGHPGLAAHHRVIAPDLRLFAVVGASGEPGLGVLERDLTP